MAAGRPRSNIVPGRRYPGYAGLWAAGGDISEFETYKNLTSGDLSGRSEKDSGEQLGPIGEIQPDDFVPIDFSDPDADFEDAVEDAVKEPDEEPDEETNEPVEEDGEADDETAKTQDEEKDEDNDEEAKTEDDDADDESNALSDFESIAKNRPRRNRIPPLKHWVGERPVYKYENGYAQLVGKTDAFCAESLKKAEKDKEKMRKKMGRVKRNTNKYKVQKQTVDAIKAKHQKK